MEMYIWSLQLSHFLAIIYKWLTFFVGNYMSDNYSASGIYWDISDMIDKQ